MLRTLPVFALLPLLGAAAAAATYELPTETAMLHQGEGKGFEAARNHCLACHSADYPNMQPPHKPKAFWDADVTKMIQLFKAQIPDEDAKAIAQYLADTY